MGPVTSWAAASTAALAVMTWLYLGARDDLAAEIEKCNAQKLEAIAEAERITREAVEISLRDRLQQLQQQAEAADRARLNAEAARIEAEARPERVRTVIREVARDPESCLNQPVPADIIRVLND